MGELWLTRDRYPEAAALFKRAIAAGTPTAGTLNSYGITLALGGQPAAAVEAFEAAARLRRPRTSWPTSPAPARRRAGERGRRHRPVRAASDGAFDLGRPFVHPLFDLLVIGGGLSLLFVVALKVAGPLGCPRERWWR